MSLTASIDLGTTSVRVCLYDEEGTRVAKSQISLSLTFAAPGIVEQDPQEYLTKAALAFHSAVTMSGRQAVDVDSIGVVSQRGTVVAWDSVTSRPLAPAISWQDQRTLTRVQEIQALGLPLNTMASCTKFEWLVQHDEQVKAARNAGTLRMGTPDVWLTWWLTSGEAFVTDPSNAGSTALYQAGAQETSDNGWSSSALAFFQQDPVNHPRIVNSSEVVAIADRAVLGSAVAVAARIGDQQSSCFANGLDDTVPLKLTLGTSAMVDRFTGSSPAESPAGTYALPLWRLDGLEDFCIEGTVLSAGSTIEWLVRLGLLDRVEDLDRIAAKAMDRTHQSPILIPALAGLGTPYMKSDIRGCFVGLDLSTRGPDLVAAAIDGIAHRCAEVIDTVAGLDLATDTAVRIDGGLAKSSLLTQRIADLSGRTMLRPDDLEMASRGGAMLAARAMGGLTTLGTERSMFQPRISESDRTESRERFTNHVDQALRSNHEEHD